jgi:hypothetical protein
MATGKGKGKDYYKSAYTHEQLWDMLNEGDDWAVERGGAVWVSAASGMSAARDEMVVHVQSLRTQWTGAAADEFERRMGIVEEYSVVSEDGMKRAGEQTIPAWAQALKEAQANAQSADLYPSSVESYDDWLESNSIDKTSPEYQTKKTQYEQQYEDYVDGRHDAMAKIVADLGDYYAEQRQLVEEEVPPPPPSDMPGNNTYQPPTGGVFANNGLTATNSSSNSLDGSTSNSPTTDTNGDGLINQDDLEPIDGEWNPGSYDDLDTDGGGGLAAGTVVNAGGGSMTTMGGTGSVGGSSLPGGAGLFGPAQGSGSPSGRGAGTSSPARSGANSKPSSSPARSGAGGRSGGLSSSSRNAINRGGTTPRGGTRSGYSDDDEEETYTRETWLREDDVDWGQTNVRREELDDDDDD